MTTTATQEQPEGQPSHAELLDAAFDVVRRYRDFHQYGSREKACKALRRRRTGFDWKQYENAFDEAVLLFAAAKNIVDSNIGVIYELEEKPKFKLTTHFEPFYRELKTQCPGFDLSTYSTALWWMLFWHHLK